VTATPDRRGDLIAQRYELDEVIGRGGQGLVYRALDRWSERMVAIKVLGSKAAREPKMAERLIREQQALSVLKGTAAVELLDVCRSQDGELCLVIELLSGKDLDEYLWEIEQRNERLSRFRIAEIFDPIVQTLEVAHRSGIIHRDLKPANVFLLDGGGVRLLDFGLARVKSAAPLTAAGTVMGSPSFMAPEMWKGIPELVDHRADVYSLGVLLFRVLTGDLPFAGESLHEKFLGSTQGARPSLLAHRPDLPAAADEWIAQALAIDRDERFGNVRALWSALLAALGQDPPGRSGSFWSAAKSAVRKLARGEQTEPVIEEQSSYDREALLRSVPAAPEPTVSIGPHSDRTIELSASELSVEALPETTLELSDGELELLEEARATAPEARAEPKTRRAKKRAEGDRPDARGDTKKAAKKQERARKRQQRKKERKRKGKR
jgi:eukaryotic-like serine/threonine-protein kinase